MINICIITCIEGRVLVVSMFLYGLYNDLFMFQTLCSYARISSHRYSRFLPDTLTHEFLKFIFLIIGLIYANHPRTVSP